VPLVAGRDQHDLAGRWPLGELGVGGADVAERERLGQRDFQFLGAAKLASSLSVAARGGPGVAVDLDPVLRARSKGAIVSIRSGLTLSHERQFHVPRRTRRERVYRRVRARGVTERSATPSP